jgi:hypothetical protein
MLAEVRAVPGVRSVSPVLTAPFSGASGWDTQVPTEGQIASDAARNPVFNLELVTPDYFETVGMTAKRGRVLMPSDRKGTEPVMVVSESVARRYCPARIRSASDCSWDRTSNGAPPSSESSMILAIAIFATRVRPCPSRSRSRCSFSRPPRSRFARAHRARASSPRYDVAPTDAATLVAAGDVLAVIGLVATLIPARASAGIDPVVAMRADA